MKFFVIVAALLLAGCATDTNPNEVPTAGETYAPHGYQTLCERYPDECDELEDDQ